MADAPTANSTWQKWHDEIELASKAKGYDQWQKRSKKIIKRYRDDRGDRDGASDGATPDLAYGAKFNILWSNVQTLMPALFAKSPKPVVERRYLDRDDVGRTASTILERALLYELDNGNYLSAVRKAVLDRLLPGRGVVWVRYEPKFSAVPQKTQGDPDDDVADTPPDENSEDDAGEPSEQEEVAYECTPVDYVDWMDFGTSPSRTWEEVWYIWKRVYMTREELVKRFPKCGADVPLDWSPTNDLKSSPGTDVTRGSLDSAKRAKILEIWDKSKRKVCWMAEGWSDQMLDEQDDPLNLEGFFPTPKPLFSTLTNETLVPVPDYHEYQDQAIELDDLTARIGALTKAVKVAGVYDASITELQRMLEEGFENRLVPCDNMTEFAQKAGSNGMGHIWLMPLKDIIEALIQLYAARDQAKQVLYEVTGISDIVRGAASAGGAKTATEQRIKGQYASMRLNDMQAEVARFCRDILRIMGEVISEHYDPMTLYLVSGFEQYAKEQWPPEEPPMMGHNGGPPMEGQAGPQPGMPQVAAPPIAPVVNPVAAAQQKAAEMFKKSVELLRNDKLRGFRIDIETDSLIEPDQQATQQARTELLGAISQFLPQAIEAGQTVPELKPLMARLLMFFLRGFKASRDIESAFEQFIDDVTKDAASPKPKPPSPEEIQAKAEIEKAQMAAATAQQDAQAKAAQSQMDFQAAQQAHAAELEKMQTELQIERERAQIEREKMEMEERLAIAEHGRKMEELAAQRSLAEHKANIDAQMADKSHALEINKMEAAEQADNRKSEREASKEADKTNSVRGTELKPLIEGIGKVIEGHGKTLETIVDGHKQLVETLSRPRKIVRGTDGRAVGVQ